MAVAHAAASKEARGPELVLIRLIAVAVAAKLGIDLSHSLR